MFSKYRQSTLSFELLAKKLILNKMLNSDNNDSIQFNSKVYYLYTSFIKNYYGRGEGEAQSPCGGVEGKMYVVQDSLGDVGDDGPGC